MGAIIGHSECGLNMFLSWLMILMVIIALFVLRCLFLVSSIKTNRGKGCKDRLRKDPVKLLVVAGSGGHTTEILRLTDALSSNYAPVHFVMAQTDKMSETKINEVMNGKGKLYWISSIPRSREVLQSWPSTLLSTAVSCLYSIPLVFSSRPDMVLVNGPGTCIPICIGAFLLTLFGVKKVTIIYVESMCRVKTMSLCGKILYHFADQILVQWPELVEKYPLSTYIGLVV